MKSLKQFLQKIQVCHEKLNLMNNYSANGISTLEMRVEHLIRQKDIINFSDANFSGLIKVDDLNTINMITYFKDELREIVKEDTFEEQWEDLTAKEKENIVYCCRDHYIILREKISLENFNFLFKEENQFLFIDFPEPIFSWINTHSKIELYKLKKIHQNTQFNQFFYSENAIKNEKNSVEEKKSVAIAYLYHTSKNYQKCWIDVPAITNKNSLLYYIYHYFNKLENELNEFKESMKHVSSCNKRKI